MTKRPLVLIISDYYLPGFRSGGGMRTIVNTVDRLGEKFDFRIITRDRDGRGDATPYKEVKLNDWNEIGKAQVFYFSPETLTRKFVSKTIKSLRPDMVYMNSFFATPTVFALLAKRFGSVGNIPYLIAPCGELSEGAMSIRSLKKKSYINLATILRLFGGIYWKSSSNLETAEIENAVGTNANITVVPDLTPKTILDNFEYQKKPLKELGKLKLVFVSRISAKKNLHFALDLLRNCDGSIEFDIFGPIEDEDYWNRCSAIIEELPPNVKVNYKGIVEHSLVAKTLFGYHLFFLPTLGENFGHIFLEALSAGCPLLISDKTPWLDLREKNIGFDIAMDKRENWSEALNLFCEMENQKFIAMAESARKFAVDYLSDSKVQDQTENLLLQVISNK